MYPNMKGIRSISSSLVSVAVLMIVVADLLNTTQQQQLGYHYVHGLVPFMDGGKTIPTFYQCYFNQQIGKQVSTAISKAIADGKKQIEINFPPVPNVDEVKFGTPLNQKFGTNIVAKDLKVSTGYQPGSDISRQQIAFANMYWAKQISYAVSGGLLGRPGVRVYSAEPVSYDQIQDIGLSISKMSPLSLSRISQDNESNTKNKNSMNSPCIVINPGGEETWDRLRSVCMNNNNNNNNNNKYPFVVLNNAYSTTYGLGNKRGYEEVYYLKRISKGWIYRAYPGKWYAYLEKPNGTVEVLQSYDTKPELNVVATLVRETSFQRYAINNDRWTPGFGERL